MFDNEMFAKAVHLTVGDLGSCFLYSVGFEVPRHVPEVYVVQVVIRKAFNRLVSGYKDGGLQVVNRWLEVVAKCRVGS